MTRPVHIFFDVDGVLVEGYHHNPARRRWWHESIQADLGIDPALLQEKFFAVHFADVVTGRRSLADALEACRHDLGYEGDVHDIIAYWLEKDSKLNEDVMENVRALAALPHTRLYIATNQEENRADHLFRKLGLDAHFRDIFYSGKIGVTKRSPAFFHAVNTALGLDPARDAILFFDDTPECIESAAQAGWKGTVFDTVVDLEGHPEIQRLLATSR